MVEEQVWKPFGTAQVGLFTTCYNVPCQLWLLLQDNRSYRTYLLRVTSMHTAKLPLQENLTINKAEYKKQRNRCAIDHRPAFLLLMDTIMFATHTI